LILINLENYNIVVALGGALHLQFTGCGFESWLAPLCSGLGQATYTSVPLSPSIIIWYRPSGSDALQLGKPPQAWWKVMAADCWVYD